MYTPITTNNLLLTRFIQTSITTTLCKSLTPTNFTFDAEVLCRKKPMPPYDLSPLNKSQNKPVLMAGYFFSWYYTIINIFHNSQYR